MIKIEDFIGGLLASANHATAVSSASSLELAEQYRAHPLMRYFPVPSSHIESLEVNAKFAFADGGQTLTVNADDAKALVDASQDLIAKLPQTRGFERYFSASPILEKIWGLRARHVSDSLLRRLTGAVFGSRDAIASAVAEHLGEALAHHLLEYHRHASGLLQTAPASASPAQTSSAGDAGDADPPLPDTALSDMQSQWLHGEMRKIIDAHPPTPPPLATGLVPGLSVMVTGSELSALPTDTLSTLTVKIGVGYRKWVAVDVDGQQVLKLDHY